MEKIYPKKMHTIQEVANKLEVTKNALRYYDKIGLVCPIRGDNGYRFYSDEQVKELMFIQVLKFGQFSLEEISLIVTNKHLKPKEEEQFNEITDLLINKQARLRHQVSQFQKIIHLLDASIEAWQYKQRTLDIQKMEDLVEQIYNNEIMKDDK
jgi:DNA-binding transcriptional MerR regulator